MGRRQQQRLARRVAKMETQEDTSSEIVEEIGSGYENRGERKVQAGFEITGGGHRGRKLHGGRKDCQMTPRERKKQPQQYTN